ncbi:MAG: hypothetical protein HY815_18865 [Candidatus Riflebacteria bacterium]|nr:hypothetical protein [Candidatus Riflebacteria bacterium]
MDMTMLLGFCLVAYLGVGAAAYLADRRWGVGIRRFFVDLVSAHPQDVRQGFIAGRSRRVWLAWSLIVACGTGLVAVVAGLVSLPAQVVLTLAATLACFMGMHLGPVLGFGVTAIGEGLDKVDQLEAKVKEAGPAVIGSAVDRGKQLTAAVVEKLTASDAPPEPTEEEARQAKIDRMDELLGKKKATRSPESHD